MTSFKLEIVTPAKTWPDKDVVSIGVPASNGRLTVLANHQPMVCALTLGRTSIENSDGTREAWQTGAGTLEVTRQGVTLLVQSASSVA